MRQTEHYKLNLLDREDKLSPKPLNENMEKLDGELAAFKASFVSEMGGRAMMAAGKYTGSGGASVTIETPGFTPKVLLIKQRETLNATGTNSSISDGGVFSSYEGWVMWIGENIAGVGSARQNYSDGSVRDSSMAYTVVFTPEKGSLTWELTWTSDSSKTYTVPYSLANNSELQVYEWVAFGVADVADWSASDGEA